MSPIPAGLTEFLLARIAEREQRAAAAPGPNWQAVVERSGSPGHWHGIAAHLVCLPGRDRFDSLSVGEEVLRSQRPARSAAVEHAVGNDPAHVLARCAADRRLIEFVTGVQTYAGEPPGWDADDAAALLTVLRLLALPDAGHRDYRPEWAP